MAKPAFDLKKMFLASVLIIAIGIVITTISTVIQVLPIVIPDEYADTLGMISMAYLILLYPVFFGLYLWSGMRASNNYGFDVVGAGIVAAFSYFVVSMIKILVDAGLTMVVLTKPTSNFGFGSIETVIASILFDTTGTVGVGISALCGFALALLGAMINFVIGGVGGWLVLRKKF